MGSTSPKITHLRLVRTEEEDPEVLHHPDVMDFDALFARYAPYIASIGLRLLGRPDEVDDLVQDVFFKAHRSMHQLQDPGAVKSWLATIAVRCAHRRLQRRRLRSFIGLDRWDEHAQLVDPNASPEVRALVTALFRELEQLPPNLRIPWTLKNIEREDLATIAQLCGCSVRTVKRRVRKAQEHLKEVWDEG